MVAEDDAVRFEDCMGVAQQGSGRTAEPVAHDDDPLGFLERKIQSAQEEGHDLGRLVQFLGEEAQGLLSRLPPVRTRAETGQTEQGQAGYGIPGSVAETSEDDWDKLMAVNVNGVFFGCKYAIPVMKQQGGGVIVNTASIVANVGIRNRAAYCASKGAVAALTRAMALDHVNDNIRVNCVAPGTIDTPYFEDIIRKSERPQELRRELEARQAMNRLGRPEEIANAFLFLASDESSFSTGSMLIVDGGMTAQ